MTASPRHFPDGVTAGGGGLFGPESADLRAGNHGLKQVIDDYGLSFAFSGLLPRECTHEVVCKAQSVLLAAIERSLTFVT